ncbi:hypothetical protein AAHA92_29749 [Salvia divinorum]|uniref:Uncharacterized protein n=1 Tax=Salvia divinorum TaxID=28513 RepID=A0ABD1FZD4_SALDI
MVKRLDDGDDVDCIRTRYTCIGEYGDEAMLLQVEGPWIHSTDDTERAFWRYTKNWFKNARAAHDIIPSTHVRNVRQGSVGSSVIATVSRTSSTGESFTSSAQNLTPSICRLLGITRHRVRSIGLHLRTSSQTNQQKSKPEDAESTTSFHI